MKLPKEKRIEHYFLYPPLQFTCHNRNINEAIDKFLEIVQGSCSFPGCPSPKYTT